jgi:hypothetical protein
MEKKQVALDLTDKYVCQQTTEVQFGVAKCTVGNKNQKKGHNTEGLGSN